jgi:hypothetical protein
MEALAKAFEPNQLPEWAFMLYQRFRPETPGGKKGSGAKGVLDRGLIPSRRLPPPILRSAIPPSHPHPCAAILVPSRVQDTIVCKVAAVVGRQDNMTMETPVTAG